MVKFKPEAYGSRILEESQNNIRMLSGLNTLYELLEQTTLAMYLLLFIPNVIPLTSDFSPFALDQWPSKKVISNPRAKSKAWSGYAMDGRCDCWINCPCGFRSLHSFQFDLYEKSCGCSWCKYVPSWWKLWPMAAELLILRKKRNIQTLFDIRNFDLRKILLSPSVSSYYNIKVESNNLIWNIKGFLFEIRKIFDLRKNLGVTNTFLKSSILCTSLCHAPFLN